MSAEELYREVVMDHFEFPRGRQPLDRVDLEMSSANPACGDELTLRLKLENGKVAGVQVDGSGCAIFLSSGSMLAEMATGLTLAEARRLAEVFKEALRGGQVPAEIDLGDLEALTGVRRFPVRVKCALLPWVTLLDALLDRAEGDPSRLS